MRAESGGLQWGTRVSFMYLPVSETVRDRQNPHWRFKEKENLKDFRTQGSNTIRKLVGVLQAENFNKLPKSSTTTRDLWSTRNQGSHRQLGRGADGAIEQNRPSRGWECHSERVPARRSWLPTKTLHILWICWVSTYTWLTWTQRYAHECTHLPVIWHLEIQF